MRNATRFLAGALVAAALGACSDSSGPSTTSLSAANADEVGASAASTVELALAAANPMVPDFTGGFPLFLSNGRSIRGGLTFAPPQAAPGDCPAASDLTDTDGDGVPDNATWTFSAADCTETDIEGNRSVVTGSVVLVDPGLTVGYDLQLNALTAQYYENGAASPALQLVMDGDWAFRGTSAALTLDQNYSYALTVGSQRVTLANDLAVDFTAASGQNISWGVPLPDGTLGIDGAWRVSSSRESFALTLLTSTPLTYDAACGGIVAGVLDAMGTGGVVRVTWTDCGIYTSSYLADAQ